MFWNFAVFSFEMIKEQGVVFGYKNILFVIAWTSADQIPNTEPVSSDEVR